MPSFSSYNTNSASLDEEKKVLAKKDRPLPLVNGTFKLVERIAKGGFGKIYLVEHLHTRELYIMKTESRETSSVRHELKIYRYLQTGINDQSRFPKIQWAGRWNKLDALIMEMKGRDLSKRMRQANDVLSFRDVMMIAIRMLRTLEHLHSKGVVHRDIKPSNILTGISFEADRHDIFLADFGTASFFRDPKTAELYSKARGVGFVGTTLFASRHVHEGISYARRDDLIALGYSFVKVLKGSLPWEKRANENCNGGKDALMESLKRLCTVRDLCDGLPESFHKYMRYCRSLRHADTPDYRWLRGLFRKDFQELGFGEDDGTFSWLDKRVEISTITKGPKTSFYVS